MSREQTDYTWDFGDGRPRSVENRARQHEEHRQRIIITLLTEFYLMAVADIFPDSFSVKANKAYWQDNFGSSEKGTQAAHCVPCQISVRGYQPQQYLNKYSPERAQDIITCFGTTDLLPAIFNKCDSYAERPKNMEKGGLVESFRVACLNVISIGKQHVNFNPNTVSTVIRNAFSEYQTNAEKSFRATITHFQQNRDWAKTEAEKKEARVQISIIEFYANQTVKLNTLNDCLVFGTIEQNVDFYRKLK